MTRLFTNTILAALLALASAFALSVESPSLANKLVPSAKDNNVSAIPAQIKRLSTSTMLDTGILGEGPPSRIFPDYTWARDNQAAVPNSALNWLLEHGSPSGKVYAALLLYERDEIAGLNAFKQIATDSSELKIKSGCEIMQIALSDAAKTFLQSKQFFGFPLKRNGDQIFPSEAQNKLNKALQLLVKAEGVESGVRGEGGDSELFEAFQTIRSSRETSENSIAWLKDYGAPGARVYAALLMWERDQQKGKAAFQKLLSDTAPVYYSTGCKRTDSTVKELAATFLAQGKLYDFPSKPKL